MNEAMTDARLGILVVDDEPQLRELFSDLLQDLGHEGVLSAGPSRLPWSYCTVTTPVIPIEK